MLMDEMNVRISNLDYSRFFSSLSVDKSDNLAIDKTLMFWVLAFF